MIRFKRKNFALPLMAIATAASVPLMIGQMKQTSDKAKQDEMHAEMAMKDNARITKALNNIANNASSGSHAAEQVSQVFASAGQKSYSLTKLGKVGLDLAKGSKNLLVGGTLAGVGIGGTNYVVDKVIQHDMKKSGIPISDRRETEEENVKTYSIVRKVGKSVLGIAAKEGKMIAGMSALTAVPTVATYMAQKQDMKDQINQSNELSKNSQERNYSKMSVLKSGLSAVKNIGSSIVKGWNKFKVDPAKSTLSGISTLAGGGGTKGVQDFGKRLVDSGVKHDFKIAQNLGNFITKNPKTALAASIPVGAAVMTGTWDAGQNLTEKGLKKLDKSAFRYRDSQEQPVE